MKSLNISKLSWVFFGLVLFCLNVGQAVQRPILYNHPRVFVPGEGTIRPGSIDKISPDGTRSTVVSDLDKPSGIALDAAGNLYYGNVTSGSTIISLFKRTRDGTVMNLGEVVNTSGGSVSVSGWGFDVAVSPSGDIFYNHPRVFIPGQGTIRAGSIDKLSPEGTRSTVVSDLDRPSGIAFDAAGNLYYGNVTSGSIRISLFKRTPDGTVTNLGEVVNTSGGSFSISGWGFDVAVSPSGDIFYNHPRVFILRQGTIRPGSIDKLSPEGTRSTVVSDLDRPSGIAFDAAGNLYYGNVTSGSIRISLFKRTPDGTVTNLGEVVNTSGGSVSIVGWGFDVAIGPAIIYVDSDARGANDGSSWTDAFNYLQDALAVAWSGDEIRVAQGIYKPDKGGGKTPGDRTASFQLKNGVAIKGGYAGFCEPDPNARDIELFETILSGDLNGNDGPNFASNDENSYHVVTGSGTDATAVLDGFIITAGRAYDVPMPKDRGGGMYNESGNPTLTNCTFSLNVAYRGGGIYNKESNPTCTNCTFNGNVASDGAGMYNYKSSPTLTNCELSGNWAVDEGGGVYNYFSTSPTLANCTFSSNSARSGGGINNRNSSNPKVINCTFSGNSADYGGGMYNKESSATLTNCILWGNTAPTGPQIYNDGTSSATVSYSDIQGGWPGQGNINANPLFVDPAIGDYHLLQTSACINAANNNSLPADTQDLDGDGNTTEPIPFDLDGNPRVVYDVVDMGPYEFYNTAPIADAGPDQIVECACNTEEGTKVTLDGTNSSDPDHGVLTYTWTGPFVESPAYEASPTVTLEDGCPGEYVITLVVSDGIDDSEPNEVVITVVDTTPPEFILSVAPTMLWPPDHKMYEITPSWTVSDECDATPDVSLVGIVANEGDDTIGDGHTSNDIQIGEDGSIYLRAERSGTANDRIYTITYQAVDDCGNTTVRSATVSIPHDFKVLARIAARWLWAGPGRIPEDLNGDGFVNLKDIAIFANNWIQ